ncbi:hypothetical protein Efla_002165 [Eimeria flavescens]
MSSPSAAGSREVCVLCCYKEQQEEGKEEVERGGEEGERSSGKAKRQRVPPSPCSGGLRRFSFGLTKLLRHEAVEKGLRMRADGFVSVSSVLALKQNAGYSVGDLLRVVATDKKQRFQLAAAAAASSSDVRTLQAEEDEEEEDKEDEEKEEDGHSLREIESSRLFSPLRSRQELEAAIVRCTYTSEARPPVGVTLVHGTYTRLLEQIKREGLKRMRRRHIHFAPFSGVYTGQLTDISPAAANAKNTEDGKSGGFAPVSGFRASCDLLLVLDFEKALERGIAFFLSANLVVLTEGDAAGSVPFECFSAAVDRKTGKLVS